MDDRGINVVQHCVADFHLAKDHCRPLGNVAVGNLVVFLALYMMTAREALLISMVRILLVSITFGNGSAFLYSMAGGILSFLVMWIFQKKDFLLPSGVSIAGGIAHNVGQLLMAAVILENGAVFTYFPVLLAAGCITGGIIGFLGEQIRKRIIRA